MLLPAGSSYTSSLCYISCLKRQKYQHVSIMIMPSSIFLKSKSKDDEYKKVPALYETVTNFHPVSLIQYV